MPIGKTLRGDFPKNRVDDYMHHSYKYEHGKIDTQRVLVQKLENKTHKFEWGSIMGIESNLC